MGNGDGEAFEVGVECSRGGVEMVDVWRVKG